MKYLFLSTAVALLATQIPAQADDGSLVPLFDFRTEPPQGWHLNVFKDHPDGGRGTATFEMATDPEKGAVARLTTEAAGTFNLTSPEIILPAGKEPLGFQIEYRTGEQSDRVDLIVCDRDDNIYMGLLPATSGLWEQQVITSFPNSRKDAPPLDLNNLKKIYIRGSGTVDVALASIQLVCGTREIPLSFLTRPLLSVPSEDGVPTVDGKLTEELWKKAEVIPALPSVSTVLDNPSFPTEVWLFRTGTKLYLAAKLRGEPKPTSGNGISDHNVWKDSSLEVFLKPDRKGGPTFQLIVNSENIRQDYQGSDVTWNGPWKSAVTKEGDGWNVEMEIDLSALDPTWNENAIWRWNVIRTVVVPDSLVKHDVVYRAGLSGTTNLLSTESALLTFESITQGAKIKGFSVIKTGPAEYALNLPPNADTLRKKAGSVNLFRVNDDGSEIFAGNAKVPPEARSVNVVLADSGRYRLEIENQSAQGSDISLVELLASTPVATKWEDIVLWPTPQKLEIGEGNLALSNIQAIQGQGEGDAFPAEHLQSELKSRYGWAESEKEDKSPAIKLKYDADAKIPEEGYFLTVATDGVEIRARSGRGMYYGARTLLDLIEQSSLDLSHPKIRHVQCEDWPQTSKRVLYHALSARYKVKASVEAVKDYIYKEVAGGRFNLYFLSLEAAYDYAAVSGIGTQTAWTRKDLKEIVDFARRHYVDIAPGGRSPGHAGWLIRANPAFGDQGDRKAMDMGNPEAMKSLLACYDELIEIFGSQYFHAGGDELRVNWTDNKRTPEEYRKLLLDHWTEIYEHLKSKGVKMVLFDDMLSPKWNGGPPLEATKILRDLPRGIIMCSWSDKGIDNPPATYDALGFKERWKVTTSFDPQRADRSLGWWKDFQGLGLGIFTTWPWTQFVHADHLRHAKYTTGPLHLSALLGWNPESLARGSMQVLENDATHWMRVMSPPDFGRTDLRTRPLSLANVTVESTPSLLVSPLQALHAGKDGIGRAPYQFDTKKGKAVVVHESGEATSEPILLEREVAGLMFLQTTNVDEETLPDLYQEFRFENENDFGLEIGSYEISYADGHVESVPIILGYNIHFSGVPITSRILEGSPAFFTAAPETHPTEPASAWVLVWKNPRPESTVKDVRLLSKNRNTPIALLGMNAVEMTQ